MNDNEKQTPWQPRVIAHTPLPPSAEPSVPVSCVNGEHVLMSDGQRLQITHMLDSNGERTDDWAEAVALVAGPTTDGRWLAIHAEKVNGTLYK
jgi:hypothetical protein